MGYQKPIEKILIDNAPAGDDITTQGIEITHGRQWSLQVNRNGFDNVGKISVEQSNDNVKWFPINNCAENVPVDDDLFFTDAIFTGKFMRLKYTAETNTAGTLTAILLLKHD